MAASSPGLSAGLSEVTKSISGTTDIWGTSILPPTSGAHPSCSKVTYIAHNTMAASSPGLSAGLSEVTKSISGTTDIWGTSILPPTSGAHPSCSKVTYIAHNTMAASSPGLSAGLSEVTTSISGTTEIWGTSILQQSHLYSTEHHGRFLTWALCRTVRGDHEYLRHHRHVGHIHPPTDIWGTSILPPTSGAHPSCSKGTYIAHNDMAASSPGLTSGLSRGDHEYLRHHRHLGQILQQSHLQSTLF
ncbi:hypothetical protein J6590_044618 [Homalodisca vitripennis]|nr:hypothetical protein J6590_044618 [Homalodisca vitripennis]